MERIADRLELPLTIPAKSFKRVLRAALLNNRGVMLGRPFESYEMDTFGVFRIRVVSDGHETDVDFYKTTGGYRLWIDGKLVEPEWN
jgi:hypothetical protein